MQFLLRACDTRIQPRYSQDEPTWILHGRWAHLWNAKHKVWFVLIPAPPLVTLCRDQPHLVRVSAWRWFRAVPWRGVLELVEDIVGLRLTFLARKLRRRFPWCWLKALANQDARQDFTSFERNGEPPRWNEAPDADFLDEYCQRTARWLFKDLHW